MRTVNIGIMDAVKNVGSYVPGHVNMTPGRALRLVMDAAPEVDVAVAAHTVLDDALVAGLDVWAQDPAEVGGEASVLIELPYTYFGYGQGMCDIANREYLEAYGAEWFADTCGAGSMFVDLVTLVQLGTVYDVQGVGDMLDELVNYPVLDDQTYSDVENRLTEESWESEGCVEVLGRESSDPFAVLNALENAGAVDRIHEEGPSVVWRTLAEPAEVERIATAAEADHE